MGQGSSSIVVKREVTSHVCPTDSGKEEEQQETVVKREVTSHVCPNDSGNEEEEQEAVEKVIDVVVKREVTSHVCPNDSGNEEEQQEAVVKREVTSHVCPNDSGNEEEQQEAVEKVISQLLARLYKELSVSRKTVLRRGPYTSIQKILLVGEGDFSFSTSLAVAFGSASNMIATSLDTQEFLTENYSKFPTNKSELELRGCMIIHDVDARKMIRHPVLGNLKFDRIIYNFPHTRWFGRSNADVRKNRNLVRGFVKNAKKMMNEDGEIHITHKSSSFFRQWDIPKIGSDQGLHLTQEIKFKCRMFPGYNPKYGFGGDESFHCDPSKTYKFILHPK